MSKDRSSHWGRAGRLSIPMEAQAKPHPTLTPARSPFRRHGVTGTCGVRQRPTVRRTFSSIVVQYMNTKRKSESFQESFCASLFCGVSMSCIRVILQLTSSFVLILFIFHKSVRSLLSLYVDPTQIEKLEVLALSA